MWEAHGNKAAVVGKYLAQGRSVGETARQRSAQGKPRVVMNRAREKAKDERRAFLLKAQAMSNEARQRDESKEKRRAVLSTARALASRRRPATAEDS